MNLFEDNVHIVVESIAGDSDSIVGTFFDRLTADAYAESMYNTYGSSLVNFHVQTKRVHYTPDTLREVA